METVSEVRDRKRELRALDRIAAALAIPLLRERIDALDENAEPETLRHLRDARSIPLDALEQAEITLGLRGRP